MSDDYLPLMIATMQQEIVSLRQRVESLEEALGQDGEGEQAGTYMDGTPIG